MAHGILIPLSNTEAELQRSGSLPGQKTDFMIGGVARWSTCWSSSQRECDMAYASDDSTLVSAIGTDRMGSSLLSYLSKRCGADHCAVFVMKPHALTNRIAASLDGTETARQRAQLLAASRYWRHDEGLSHVRNAKQELGLIHCDMNDLKSPQLRHEIYYDVAERLLLFGRPLAPSAIVISVVRTSGRNEFKDNHVNDLQNSTALLMAAVAKHIEYCDCREDAGRALSSLEQIERCIHGTQLLTRREAEVCARTVYGMSTVGIAHALDVGEESVKTYRRRAYEKLGIGSSREVVSWYLTQWSQIGH